MLEMSGNLIIKNPGDNNLRGLKLFIYLSLIFIFSLTPQGSHAQICYLNAYGQPNDSLIADLYLKSIDLTSSSIIDSIKLEGRGVIWSKKPVTATIGNRTYLICVSESGMITTKNSRYEDQTIVYYSIFRQNRDYLALLRSDSLIGVTVDILRQYPAEQGFRFGLRRDNDNTEIFPEGLYSLNQGLNFQFLRRFESINEPGILENFINFDFLIKLPLDNLYNLYYGVKNLQMWAVRLNSDKSAIIDSLQLQTDPGAATLFAYHPLRNKFYRLQVNYELHTGQVDSIYKTRQDGYVNPEVFIYDPQNLQLLEQYPIADYPEGQYPGAENGLADVIGDFIVYYFFEGDEYYNFYPAMLFIFDTRTNQATWLRVGWR